MIPDAAMSPPSAPSAAPVMNPTRLPARAIHIDAGTVATTVPRIIALIGTVASCGAGAI
jgi:hypothetical protein